jgi:hypothetical protein
LLGAISLATVILYEFLFFPVLEKTGRPERAGILISRVFYSTLASSIFYYVSQYFPVVLPRRTRKIKILELVFQKSLSIEWYLSRLRSDLRVIHGEFSDRDKFRAILEATKTEHPVSTFPNWFEYLKHMRERIVELTRAITIHGEYLDMDFLQEVLVIEKHLLAPGVFEGTDQIPTGNLRWAEIQLQELLIHNVHLQRVRDRELAKHQKELEAIGIEYRATYYAEYDRQQTEHTKKQQG